MPVLVGGSGLYVRAALDRLEIPPTDPEVRCAPRLEVERGRRRRAALHARLARARPGRRRRRSCPATCGGSCEPSRSSSSPVGRSSPAMPEREFVRPSRQLGLRLDRAVARRPHRPRGCERMWRRGLAARDGAPARRAGCGRGGRRRRALGYARCSRCSTARWPRTRPAPTRSRRRGASPGGRRRGSAATRASCGSTPTAPGPARPGAGGGREAARRAAARHSRSMTDHDALHQGPRHRERLRAASPTSTGALELTPSPCARCRDRRAGIGGDGVIRVVRTALRDRRRGARRRTPDAEWFMDYRNADGSLAEMCGNGVRVFVAYLLREGLVTCGRARSRRHACRRQDRAAATDDLVAVDLGPWCLVDGRARRRDGFDVMVEPRHGAGAGPGVRPRQPARRRRAAGGRRPRDRSTSPRRPPAARPAGRGQRRADRAAAERPAAPDTCDAGARAWRRGRPARAAPARSRRPSRPASGAGGDGADDAWHRRRAGRPRSRVRLPLPGQRRRAGRPGRAGRRRRRRRS